MHTLTRNAIAASALLAAGGASLALVARTAKKPDLSQPAAAAIPAGAQVLATLDVRRLRSTPAFALLAGRGREATGGELKALCGFDPVEQADEIALSVPGSAGDGELGVAASGAFVASSIGACAARAVGARGGRAVTLREGDFVVVTDVSGSGSWVVAARDGGPVLAGGAAYVRQMMAAVERRAPSVLTDARHVALRGEVGDREALVVSALLTADGRDRVRAELGDPSAPAASVLGLSLSATATDPVSLHAMIGCDRPEPCAQLARSLESLRSSDEAELGRRLLGLREPLDRATVTASGPTVHVRLELPQATLTTLATALVSPR